MGYYLHALFIEVFKYLSYYFRGYFSAYKEDYYSRAVHSWLGCLCKQSKFSFSPGSETLDWEVQAGSVRAAPLQVEAWPSSKCFSLLKSNASQLATPWPEDVRALLGCTWTSLNCICRWSGCMIPIYLWSHPVSDFGMVASSGGDMTQKWI